MDLIEARDEYARALKAGQKECRECIHKGIDPNPIALDDFLGKEQAENYGMPKLVNVWNIIHSRNK